MSGTKKQRNYYDSVHFCGRLWSIGALLVMFSLPVGISAYYNAWPEAGLVFKALVRIMPLYWLSSIVEVITFTPMLGAGGTYLSFVTGNITNLKLPCALSSMEQAGVTSNSEEGEVISTISIAASSITTTAIIAIGVLLFSPVLPALRESELLKPAFSYVSSALFGAIGASYLLKYWKISILPILAGIIVLIFVPDFGVSTLLFITIVVSVAGAFGMYKLKWIK